MNEAIEPYATKARECIDGARSELANGRYNNAANRAYYGAYNAAIVALIRAGLTDRNWTHAGVQSLFARELLHRRKLYPSSFRSLLPDLATMRLRADYARRTTGEREAFTVVRNAERFLAVLLGSEP